MTTPDFKQALEVLKSHNTWRRGCDITPMTDPKELGVAIDSAIVALQIADALMQEPVTMTINDLAKVLYEYMARCSETDDLLQDMILVAKKLEKIGLIKVIKND